MRVDTFVFGVLTSVVTLALHFIFWPCPPKATAVDVRGDMINVHGSALMRITENPTPDCGFAVYDNGVFKHGVEFDCGTADGGAAP